MAKIYGTNTAPRGANPIGVMDGSLQGGHVRVYRETINLASQAVINAADTIVVAYASKGETFLFGMLTASATMGGTATLAIGNSTTSGKYRTAAIFTAVETPTLFGAAAAGLAALTKLTADEEVIITIAAASLPASGILTCDTYWAQT